MLTKRMRHSLKKNFLKKVMYLDEEYGQILDSLYVFMVSSLKSFPVTKEKAAILRTSESCILTSYKQ